MKKERFAGCIVHIKKMTRREEYERVAIVLYLLRSMIIAQKEPSHS